MPPGLALTPIFYLPIFIILLIIQFQISEISMVSSFFVWIFLIYGSEPPHPTQLSPLSWIDLLPELSVLPASNIPQPIPHSLSGAIQTHRFNFTKFEDRNLAVAAMVLKYTST